MSPFLARTGLVMATATALLTTPVVALAACGGTHGVGGTPVASSVSATPVSPIGSGNPGGPNAPTGPGNPTKPVAPVAPVATTTAVTVSSTAQAGQPFGIYAHVGVGRSHPHGIKKETGTVIFNVDGKPGQPVTIKRGRAHEEITLGKGQHTIVASYSGDADHKASTSQPVTFTLN